MEEKAFKGLQMRLAAFADSEKADACRAEQIIYFLHVLLPFLFTALYRFCRIYCSPNKYLIWEINFAMFRACPLRVRAKRQFNRY